MTAYLRLFLRGFLIVCLTAMNVSEIAGGHYLAAFIVGFGISFVWWFNARNAARSDIRFAGTTYALGAGVGTVTGMLLSRLTDMAAVGAAACRIVSCR